MIKVLLNHFGTPSVNYQTYNVSAVNHPCFVIHQPSEMVTNWGWFTKKLGMIYYCFLLLATNIVAEHTTTHSIASDLPCRPGSVFGRKMEGLGSLSSGKALVGWRFWRGCPLKTHGIIRSQKIIGNTQLASQNMKNRWWTSTELFFAEWTSTEGFSDIVCCQRLLIKPSWHEVLVKTGPSRPGWFSFLIWWLSWYIVFKK